MLTSKDHQIISNSENLALPTLSKSPLSNNV